MTSELHRLAGTLMDLSGVTSVRMNVQGVGAIDPFVNWASILQPKPVLEASNVAGWALQAAGRLEGLRARAKALAAPDLDPVRLHPLVWAAAQRLWNDGHRRHAVAAAAEAVSGQMKQLTDRNDAPDTSLWQQAFSKDEPLEGKPRLRWPGDTSDQDVKMNGRRNTQRDQRRQGHAANIRRQYGPYGRCVAPPSALPFGLVLLFPHTTYARLESARASVMRYGREIMWSRHGGAT